MRDDVVIAACDEYNTVMACTVTRLFHHYWKSHGLSVIADSKTKGHYSHRPGESLADCLEPINHFPVGDPGKVQAEILLLELLSLNDYRTDIHQDIINGEQNPLIVDIDFQEEQDV